MMDEFRDSIYYKGACIDEHTYFKCIKKGFERQ